MLVIDHITKSFGKKEIIKNVSFEVKKGETFGLLGPNGAGKSTTISMICGLISYDSGDIKVGGKSVKEYPLEAKRKLVLFHKTLRSIQHFQRRKIWFLGKNVWFKWKSCKRASGGSISLRRFTGP